VKAPERLAAAERPVPRIQGSFLGPFGHRDFALLWSGLLVGNLGTWFQFVALGYYVATLAPSTSVGAFYIGLLGASRMLPVLFTSPFAGVVADRYPRRRILLSTNLMTALTAFVLALALLMHFATLPVVLLISGVQGATQSFDAPARQSWVPLLVPRELVGNAIGLNSFAFNAPSVIGPPLAGLLIWGLGVAPCMIVNAVVKFAVVAALVFMKPSPPSAKASASFAAAFVEGVRFIVGHGALRWVYLMAMMVALSVRSYNFLLPAYSVHVLQIDARGLGLLTAASGVGGVIGALVTAAFNVRRRAWIWFVAGTTASLGMAALGATNVPWVAAIVLMLLGLTVQGFSGGSNILVQTLAPDEMRGRVVSVYSMILLGFIPGGALVIGTIARFVDLRTVFVGAGLFCAAAMIWTFAANAKLRAV
jgi:MFS family permease